MSSPDPPESGGAEPRLRRRAGKEPERSNFAQTCSLLSQYFKERGALGVASKLEAANKAMSDTSMAAQGTKVSLIPRVEKSGEAAKMSLLLNRVKSVETPDLNEEPSSSSDLKSMDFLAKLAAPPMEGSAGKFEFRRPAERDPSTAQMTIFYAGKVIVYNDFPADKARDIMGEAEKYANSYCVSRTHELEKIKFSSAIVTESSIVSTTAMKEPVKKQPQANGSDLPIPIATRSSLHRFFSKRKDRAAAKAPYQVNGRINSPPPVAGQSRDQWPDVEILEGLSSKQPDVEILEGLSSKQPDVEMLEGQSSKQPIDLNL